MEIRAYDKIYLGSAQNTLGHAVDFAIMTLDISPATFGKALAVSSSGKQFAKGNPYFISGINGCQLARHILNDSGIAYTDSDDSMYLDKSPEYWSGWAIAFYQWYADTSFTNILHAISLEKIINMYPVYHEMDILHFCDQLNKRMKEAFPHTRLREKRKNIGLSQAKLAQEADVPVRQIQLFEQGQRDINKASAITLYKLSKILSCQIEDLLEPTSYNSFHEKTD